VSLFVKREATLAATLQALGLPLRSGSSTAVSVNSETALRHSAVWACLRVRADLISTTPIDVMRRVMGVQVEVAKPPLLVTPDGDGIEHWLYSTQFDLDRFGNTFGIITERDGLGFPSRIDLVPAQDVTVVVEQGVIAYYRIAGVRYDPRDIHHERQYTVAGLHVGLSPIAYAAYSIGTYLSAQEFALDWFGSGAAPTGHLRNVLQPTIAAEDAQAIKSRFKEAVKGRDLFVTGRDWEYHMAEVPANTVMFLDQMNYGVVDVCRFLSVPADIIDAYVGGSSITYANVMQRNLQLLIINLGPAYTRRERALSRLVPSRQYVKFNTNALLRMDPEARARILIEQVKGRVLAPSEAREIENRQPFSAEQYAEFDRLFGNPNAPKPGQQFASAPDVHVHVPQSLGVPDVHVHNDYSIDATSQHEHAIDARSLVEVHPEISVRPPADKRSIRTIERDANGDIARIIEEG
jgi:HK97 family phage portal protein